MSVIANPILLDPEFVIGRECAKYAHNPLDFVRVFIPWGRGELADAVGPRKWQAELLDSIGKHLRDPRTMYTPFQCAVASGHGIGKSALVAFLISWAMSTCENCKVVITANTGTQLATKTQPECDKWFRYIRNKHWFEVKATSITSTFPNMQRTWRTDFIPWSENNTEAFAGLHNKGKRIVVVYDEASAISDKIWEVTEGALTDKETEIIWLAFGNPTLNTGRFRECFGKFKHRWVTRQIDSREVEGTNLEQIEQWRQDYGEDSDFFRIRARGEFPRASSNQFIPSDVVASCRKFRAQGYESLPTILGVDVARFGDDQTVVFLRQGRFSKLLGKYRGLDTVEVAQRVIEFRESVNPDAIIVDGDGLGAGVIDQMRHRGYGRKLFEFHGNENANDSAKYFNKRTEVWGMMRDWLSDGAEIPDLPDLEEELCSPQYFTARGKRNGGSMFLEHKDDMKRRGLASPDLADALAMTFAENILAEKREVPPQPYYPRTAGQGWMAT